MKVLVVGAGKMVSAILHGLKGAQDLSQFWIFSPSGKSARDLAEAVGARWARDLVEVADFDFVLLGHKPQQLPEVGLHYGAHLSKAPILSLLAAVPEAQQRKLLGATKLIRVMPNLPVRYQRGVTLLTSSSALDEIGEVQKLFSLLGEVFTLSEAEFEELTLLTGSGPAFFYEFTKNLSECFSSLGPVEREKMARATLLGAAVSSSHDEARLEGLISEVTSKAGVTIAVLEKWRELGLKDDLKEGINRGLKRTQEIKDSLLRN